MNSICVQGGVQLQGEVAIQGSKNAALPILAGCLLVDEPVILENCPKISDVRDMLRILECLGCEVKWKQKTLVVRAKNVMFGELPEDAVGTMRSSVFLLGALLARCGVVEMDAPGGCVIGKRPIDMHVDCLEKLGAVTEKNGARLRAQAPNGLEGRDVLLQFPSVGVTENLLLAAVAAKGTTRILGAAKEPEVQALCEFLNACGARIKGIGERVLSIEGGRRLKGCSYRIPADRIVAGTYLLSGFITGGEMFLEDAPANHMEASLELAERMGASITLAQNGVYAQFPKGAGELSFIETGVYPGFPTDLQSVLLAVRCTGKGKTVIRERIFENRFRIVDSLISMGARIKKLDDDAVMVEGVNRLVGKEIEAMELRGGAALVAAALNAEGECIIRGSQYIERGYENIVRDYRELGARIVSE